MYNTIGGKSPILDITTAQAKALEASLNSELPTPNSQLTFRVYTGMRYWHPFIEDTVKQMYRDGIRRIIALSLYPHYSIATTGSAISRFDDVIMQYDGIEAVRISSWFSHAGYIDALVEVIKKGIKKMKGQGANTECGMRNAKIKSKNQDPKTKINYSELRTPDSEFDVHVLFSAHSLPMSIVESGDPYVNEIKGTIAEVLKKIDVKWDLSFQSKSGPVKWLEPTTEEKIRELAGKGVGNLLVVPISFVSDHIETLYEIDILYKRLADKLNIKMMRAESLNTNQFFIDALEDIIIMRIKETGWQG